MTGGGDGKGKGGGARCRPRSRPSVGLAGAELGDASWEVSINVGIVQKLDIH